MRLRLISLLPLVALAGCQSARSPTFEESEASLATSGYVALTDFAHEQDLSYHRGRGGIVELCYPPDAVVLVPGERSARVNGRALLMDQPLITIGEDFALSRRDAELLRLALGESRRARPTRAPAPAVTLPSPRADFPALWMPRGRERRWSYIVIHHTATPSGNAAIINRAHLANKWENGLGYHFVVGNGSQSADGEVEVGRRWTEQLQGAHTKIAGDATNRWNETAIGVCLVGDFTKAGPSSRQLDATARLVAALCRRYGISPQHVLGHGHIDSTECPGHCFPWEEFRARLGR
ncbi:MAG: peptidoglycan recognition protein family protein [Planctomycetaceae bacterium]